MNVPRRHVIAEFVQPSPTEPIRSVMAESPDSVLTVWHVLPGQTVSPHTHPHGQDTWVILSGHADYIYDAEGHVMPVQAGMVMVAHRGQVHGAHNTGTEPFQFVSVVAPATAGFRRIEAE